MQRVCDGLERPGPDEVDGAGAVKGGERIDIGEQTVGASYVADDPRQPIGPGQRDDERDGRLEFVAQLQRRLKRVFVTVGGDIRAGKRWRSRVGVIHRQPVDVTG